MMVTPFSRWRDAAFQRARHTAFCAFLMLSMIRFIFLIIFRGAYAIIFTLHIEGGAFFLLFLIARFDIRRYDYLI